MSELDNKLKKIIQEVRGLHATDPRLQKGDLITHTQYLKGLGFELVERTDLDILFNLKQWLPKGGATRIIIKRLKEKYK
ncbi:hypothetical protein LCGC14_2066180 [marine sediment metagenome]|uniref:Uncharacterized protein n=1 Tax=marine sediment metagenome TaxID=412755 RepID=A0A0F9F762_9ZZZZ